MHIYRSMADGLLSEENEGLASDMRVIEVDGTPTPVVGIRYKGGAPGQAEVTRDGKLTGHDEGLPPPDEYEEDREYWADRPSGCCGGARLRSTLREDILVNRLLIALIDASAIIGKLSQKMLSTHCIVLINWAEIPIQTHVFRRIGGKLTLCGPCSRRTHLVLSQRTGKTTACQAWACFWRAMWYAIELCTLACCCSFRSQFIQVQHKRPVITVTVALIVSHLQSVQNWAVYTYIHTTADSEPS